MTATSLLEILQLLEEAGIRVWLDGGWGIDALIGEQTRPHGDLDIIIDSRDVPLLRGTLEVRGFFPLRDLKSHDYVLSNGSGLEVDVHAVTFDGEGDHRPSVRCRGHLGVPSPCHRHE
jgi:lincosamide nucleotidyltransferase A/C/D/E